MTVARFWVRFLFFFLLSCWIDFAQAQFGFKFPLTTGTLPPELALGLSATLTANGSIDPINKGWLRLTSNRINTTGWALIDRPLDPKYGLMVEFEYKAWLPSRQKIGDGISVFLCDGETTNRTNFVSGTDGGGLGLRRMRGGYVGVALDEYGNSSKVRNGPHNIPNSISIIKMGAGASRFGYLVGTGEKLTSSNFSDYPAVNVDPALAGTTIGYSTPTSTRPKDELFYRKTRILFLPVGTTNNLQITVQLQKNQAEPFYTVIQNQEIGDNPFNKLKIGLVATTGGSVANHEIRNLAVCTPIDLRVTTTVDKGSVKVGEALNYTTVISNLGPGIIEAQPATFSVETTGVTIPDDITSIIQKNPQQIIITKNRARSTTDRQVYDITNLPVNGTITLNYTGIAMPARTNLSAINKALIEHPSSGSHCELDEENNTSIVQSAFIKPVLEQPSDITLCPGESINKILVSDDPSSTSYTWTFSPSSHEIDVKTYKSKNHIIHAQFIDNEGEGGTVVCRVTPAIKSPTVYNERNLPQATLLGDPKSFKVIVKPTAARPSVSAGHRAIYYKEDVQLIPTSSLTTPIYRWYNSANKMDPITDHINQNGMLTKSGLLPGTYTFYVTVSSVDFCESKATPVKVVVNAIPIQRPSNLFSPNNDGINDNWVIENIQQYPHCTVQIFNRWGSRVYFSVGYYHPWDGTHKGHPLPVANYHYIIDLKNGTPLIKGSVSIVR